MAGSTVTREALLERLARLDPRVIVIVAPAGFGKSTLVRQYLAQRGGGALCDCTAVRDDLDLARRVIPALAAESPARVADLTQREVLLGDADASVAERVELTLDVWREPTGGCIVFENADALTATPAALAFFERMLEVRPPERTIIICSREPLRVHLTRYVVPHEIVTLRAADLAFDVRDIRTIFAPFVTDDAAIERVARVSEGWPVAVFLLRRFASEGRIEQLLERLDDVAFGELHGYFTDEVLGALDRRTRAALFACAAIPQPNPDDLCAALDDPRSGDDFAEYAKDSAFVEQGEDGVFILHPLLASLLLGRAAERRDVLLAHAAAAHEARADYQRAAELYLARGDQHAAARALGSLEVLAQPAPSMRYARVLSSLDRSLVVRYPRLWGVTALMRIFCIDSAALLDESETVWRTLSPDASPLERYYVFVFRILLMSYLGLFDKALAEIAKFGATVSFADPPKTMLDGHLLYLRGLLRARRGNFDSGERDLNAALPLIDRMHVAASGTYLALGADVARVRGEWSLERQFLARARERAASSGLPNFMAFDTAESLIAAWFAGDRTTFNELAAELENAVVRSGVAGFAYLAGIARGRSVRPAQADIPKFVIFGHLIALSRSRDEDDRARLAHAALDLASKVHMPFIEALAAIAVALCDSDAFDAACASAKDAAGRCDAPAFVHAVNAFANEYENVGMLSNFVAQITRDRSEAAPIALEILAGRVRVDGAVARLSGREFELLTAIAQRREPTMRSRLADLLWPDLDEFAGRNALSVCLHRLRAHLGREDAIERDADGYRLHVDAFVDVWEIERAVATLRGHNHIRESERAALRRAWERLCAERYPALERWEWFEPVMRRMSELRTAIAHRLAEDALESGDPDAALAYAVDVIEYDPCDELAREIAIRAHLANGDRAAALRSFRQYRDVLRSELQVEPSATLASLLAGT
jgi:DNA-binding SARP family transcriptional activator